MKTSPKLLLTTLAFAVLQAAALSAFAADADENKGQLSSSDYNFAKEAAAGGSFEVNLGDLAASKSTNTSVQQFGHQMAKDHGQAGQNLHQIIQNKGATVPSELSSHQQREVDRLSKLSGRDFDKAYMGLMVHCHEMDEKAFKKESENGKDAELKNFASTTLMMVQEHLKMARDLENNLKSQYSSNP